MAGYLKTFSSNKGSELGVLVDCTSLSSGLEHQPGTFNDLAALYLAMDP